MKIKIGDTVVIAPGTAIADYEPQDNLVILLAPNDSVIIYPGRAPPFFFEPKKIFFPPPYEDREDDSSPPRQYHLEKLVKINDRQTAVKYRLQLTGTFDEDGAYCMIPLDHAKAPIIYRKVEPIYKKPEEFSAWLQTDLNPESLSSEIIRLYSNNGGKITYYDEVPEELAQTMRAVLSTLDGGHTWWCPIRLLEKI